MSENFNEFNDYSGSDSSYGYYPVGGTVNGEAVSELDARSYNTMIAGCLLWGFLVNYLICHFMADVFINMNPMVLLIGYIICAFAGIMIFQKSDSAVISFIGYNMVALPIGAVLSVILVGYSTTVIQYAFLATAIVTIIMVALSSFYPASFLSMGKTLFFSLLAAVVAETVMVFIFRLHLGAFDYVIAVIFSLYIGYDMARAQKKAYTYNNAVDAAAELYLDIINLFIRILSIMGRNRD